MARAGYRFFDTDAHVGPYVDVLEPYLSADDKRRLEAWAAFKSVNKNGHVSYNKGQRTYQRRLYSEQAEKADGGYMAGFTGVKRKQPISPGVDRSSAARICPRSINTWASVPTATGASTQWPGPPASIAA